MTTQGGAADPGTREARDSGRSPWDSWPPWLNRDGSGGVPHYIPGTEDGCPYLGMIICTKCGWIDRDQERVRRQQAARETRKAADAGARMPEFSGLFDPAGVAPADIIACLTLDVEPVPKARARVSPAEYALVGGQKVRTKKAHGYTPKRVGRYETHVGWLLKAAHVRCEESRDVGVSVRFHVAPVPGKAKGADLDNLVKSLLDACNGVAWRDDAQVARLAADLARGSSRPRVELLIWVLPAGGESP